MKIGQRDVAPDCGCSVKGYTSLDDALSIIDGAISALPGMETLPLTRVSGRILAREVRNPAPLPRFDNAAMDGYAVASSSFKGNGPWVLPVMGRCAAGEIPRPLVPGTAMRIFTGAALPRGADSVIMQEAVQRQEAGIEVLTCPAPGVHVRHKGEEQPEGAVLLPEGRRLGASEIAVLAAAGTLTVPVRQRPRVALVVTGSEVAGPAGTAHDAQVHDVNTPFLTATLQAAGNDPIETLRLDDTPGHIADCLADLKTRADLIVTTGGLSVGEEDHLHPVLAQLGMRPLVSGVALKPGKPVSFGHLGSAVWLGLPGNPLAAFVTWQLFGKRILSRLSGQTHRVWMRQARLGTAISRKPGRSEVRLARLDQLTPLTLPIAHCLPTRAGQVTHLAQADGMVLLPPDQSDLPAEAVVPFLPFNDR